MFLYNIIVNFDVLDFSVEDFDMKKCTFRKRTCKIQEVIVDPYDITEAKAKTQYFALVDDREITVGFETFRR